MDYTGSETTKIIAFEGTPLTGKTTQAELLENHLSNSGHDVITVKRATEHCPTREEINELREKADGFTREEISVDKETELWAQYYQEKNEFINRRKEEGDLDYIIVDRYYLSLLPVQEPALDQDLEELVNTYQDQIEQLDPNLTIVLTAEEDNFRDRYTLREGGEVPEDFLNEVKEIQENYRELGNYFELEYLDTSEDTPEIVHSKVLEEMDRQSLLP